MVCILTSCSAEKVGCHACPAECDVPVPGIPGTGNFHFFWWYRNRYRKNLVPEKSTGIGKIWYRKKVSEPVSEKFGTGKSIGTGTGKN